MKQMHIPCSTAQEKQEVINYLVSIGYRDTSTKDDFLNITTYEDGDIMSTTGNTWKFELVTPSQLLNKQEAPTMNKLKEAVQNSGLNKSELSIRLGKSRKYIGEMLRIGCSTKKQNELIEMINQVKSGERFKSDDEIIAELSEKLEIAQDEAYQNRQKTILDGITIGELQTKNSDLIRIANQKSEQVKNLSTRNTDLEKALTDERKNAQNQAQRITDLEGIVMVSQEELTELRATNAKYKDELTKAGEELLKQDKVIEYRGQVIEQRNNECIRLEDEITLINKENSELNKQRKSYMAAFFMLLSLVVICLLWSAFK